MASKIRTSTEHPVDRIEVVPSYPLKLIDVLDRLVQAIVIGIRAHYSNHGRRPCVRGGSSLDPNLSVDNLARENPFTDGLVEPALGPMYITHGEVECRLTGVNFDRLLQGDSRRDGIVRIQCGKPIDVDLPRTPTPIELDLIDRFSLCFLLLGITALLGAEVLIAEHIAIEFVLGGPDLQIHQFLVTPSPVEAASCPDAVEHVVEFVSCTELNRDRQILSSQNIESQTHIPSFVRGDARRIAFPLHRP